METLRGRDVRGYAGDLISLIRDEVAYQVRPVNGPGQPGALLIQGDQVNHGRIYAPPPLPDFQLFAGEPIFDDGYGLPVVQRTTGMMSFMHDGGSIQLTGQQYLSGKASLSPADQEAFSTIRGDHRYEPDVWMYRLSRVSPIRGSDFTVGINRTITDTFLTEAYVPIGRMIVEVQKSAMVMQQQLKNDVQEIESYNQAVSRDNERIVTVLNNVSGQKLGPDREAWKSWWSDQLGYDYVPPKPYPRPTVVEMVPPAYVPQSVQPSEQLGPLVGSSTSYTAYSQSTQSGSDRYAALGLRPDCFGAGTPVLTLTGSKPIEELRVGDRVLSRDQKTGGLVYRPVVTVFHYPPAGTLRLVVEDEPFVTSPLHRFWRVGDGWIMARDLKPGDVIRSLAGRAVVKSVKPDLVQPVFNLNVADDSTFLVGRQGVLVHDNTLPDIRPALFDAPPALAQAEGKKK